MAETAPKTNDEWLKALNDLPASPERIPAFFFAHSSPMMEADIPGAPMGKNGPLSQFLQDFGRILVEKYSPKAIVVFSAHWDTEGTRLVTDYGDENPLYYDYYGFPDEFFNLKFKSRGDSELANRIVDLYTKAGLTARTTPVSEPRGVDGLGRKASGFDHGVFIPFRRMFGFEMDIPIVEVSIDSSFDPEVEWKVGQALDGLRSEGILLLSGGLTIHNLRDRTCFIETKSASIYKEFDSAVAQAVQVRYPQERKKVMFDLTNHKGFRASHPTADHFVPIYVAGGAGGDGDTKVLAAIHGALTVASGL